MAASAQQSASVHLAPLDLCLTRQHRLISWRSAYERLYECSASKTQCPPTLVSFFTDQRSIQQLSDSYQPFPAPSKEAKEDLETRTSAVSVTPADDESYNIQQIREDALWISEQAKIDEVSALRIVILEWQSRPTTRVLSGYAEEERISLQKALGREAPFPPQEDTVSFTSKAARHARLVEIYLEERLFIIKSHAVITSLSLLEAPQPPADRKYPTLSVNTKPTFDWVGDVETKVQAAEGRRADVSDWAGHLFVKSITAVSERLKKTQQASAWSVENPDLETRLALASHDHQLAELVGILQVVFVSTCASPEPYSGETVQSWFSLMQDFDFLSGLSSDLSHQQTLISSIHLLISTISLSILKLPYALDRIAADQDPAGTAEYYFQSESCLQTVTAVLSGAGRYGMRIAGPAMFALAEILQTLRDQLEILRGDMDDEDAPESPLAARATPGAQSAQRILEAALQHIPTFEQDIDPIQALARMAIDQCHVFPIMVGLGDSISSFLDSLVDILPQIHARIALLELLRHGIAVTSYSEQAIETGLAVLDRKSAQSDVSSAIPTEIRTFVAEAFLADTTILSPMLFEQSRLRFPYEQSPFLLLAECLSRAGPSVGDGADFVSFQNVLHTSSKFTQTLPLHFSHYELTREDENANAIRLTDDLPLFVSRRSGGSNGNLIRNRADALENTEDSFNSVRAGTLGVVISEGKPPVVVWEFEFSLWTYFGAILSTIPLGSTRSELSPAGDARDVAPTILNLMAVSMSGPTSRQSEDDYKEQAQLIMEEASDSLDRGQDIVTLVFEIFEQELSRHVGQRGEESTDLLVSCVRFAEAALRLVPHRVWPALARTGLLNNDGEGGKLMAVAGSTEIVLGRYDFVIATAHLFQALVDDVLAHCIPYEAQSSTLTRHADRFNEATNRPPSKITSSLLLAFSRCYLDILQSSAEWTFIDQAQQLELTITLSQTFDTILTSVFGYDDSVDAAQRITKVLYPAARHLSQSFLSENASQLAVNSLILRVVAGAQSFQQAELPFRQEMSDTLATVMRLCMTLLHVCRVTQPRFTFLHAQLFRAVASLVRLFTVRRTLRVDVLQLLTVLVQSGGELEKEPPSLFGHLGSDVSKDFLRILGDKDQSLQDSALREKTWTFLEAVVSNRQQWFATYMLTGSNPRERLQTSKSKCSKEPERSTLLETALDALTQADNFESPWAMATLRFVSQAQNHWPWVTNSIRKHSKILEKLGENAGVIHEERRTSSITEQYQLTKLHSSVAVVAEILAMFLHNMRQMGDVSFVRQLAPKIEFLRQKGFFQPKYADGLHKKLRANFEAIYPGGTTQCFKRLFGDSELGSDYYYDLHFAQKLLSFHPSWDRKAGFKEEFVRANINLSLVESQIQAISSWRILAVELSRSIDQEESLQKPLGHLVVECLELCNSADLSHKIFTQVVSSCADLALTILQRLVATRSNVEVMRSVLRPAWILVQRAGEAETFVGDAAPYYRTALKILLLAIQPHTWPAMQGAPSSLIGKDGRLSETSTILLDVVSEVVAKGFRTLAAELHENPENIHPADFAVITAILQATMQVQAVDALHSLISLRLSDSGCVRYATALFSWSDKLTLRPGQDEEEGDPIFGELSLSFLLELSNLQPMAEFLASESILSQLNTASIMKFFRRPRGSGPYDTPSPRLYAIWSRGILPLCLNLLLTVGESIAMEVAMFLNNFPEQLRRASSGFDDKPQPSPRDPTAGCIALDMAAEAQTLALLGALLDRCRASPSGAAALGGEIPQLDGWDRAMVREDLETWLQGGRAALRERLLPTNEREVAWLRQPPSTTGDAAGSAGFESRLEGLTVRAMEAALRCLSLA